MSIKLKRYRKLLVTTGLFLLILIYLGTVRIISYNIGNKGNITTSKNDIENTIDIFDTSKMHEIKILMSSGEYADMLNTYTEIQEKDYYKVDILVDGIIIEDVGIRLKGNSSLMQATNTRGGMGGDMGNREMTNGTGFQGLSGVKNMPENFKINSGDMNSNNMTGNQEVMRQMIGGYGGSSGDQNTDYLPLLIKFDKYIDGQTYQGRSMIALRKAGFSDKTLLAEPAAYNIYINMGKPAPSTSYGKIQIDGKTPQVYIVSEVVEDEYYLNKYFTGDNGILFKVDSFSSFTYLGEDPTLYADIFAQKTNINDDDMSQLIKMIKFVSTSNDEEFESELNNYIDVDSVLHILAIDTFVQNNDSFGGAGNNYYLYYYKAEKKFYMLTRDQNLAFGGMGGGMKGNMGSGMQMPGGGQLPPGVTTGDMEQFMNRMRGPDQKENPFMIDRNFEKTEGIKGGMQSNRTNDLKDRLLKNNNFKGKFDEIYEKIKIKVFSEKILDNFFDTWSNVFMEYNDKNNLIDQNIYSNGLASLKNFINDRKDSTSDEVNDLKMGGGGR